MTKETAHTTERPPIVVVLGHVDHGKSTLLDFIRKTNTTEKEAGGITQKVAAYEVTHTPQKLAEQTQNNAEKTQRPSASSPRQSALSEGKRITFIDTPGHAAFQAIRARGANVADIAILVVAADDGVKEQTLEALESIRAAEIPFIVAINKIDKPNADVSRTQSSLLEKGVYLEKLGGDVPWVAISAKAGTGIDELLDLVLIVAEFKELKANPSVPAEGYVIETHRDPKRGIAATLIITNGTLKSGAAVCAGHAVSPVRIMENHAGKSLREASFSTPVLLVGFDEMPPVGATFKTFTKKKDAEAARAVETKKTGMQANHYKETFMMPVIVRADSTGSLEAIALEASRLGDEHARVHIVQSGVGAISEGDVKGAMSGENRATIIGFNVSADAVAEEHARQHGIQIETFDIIYKLTERLQELLKHATPKRLVKERHGNAKIIRQFSSRKDVHVVGGKVLEGFIAKKASVRVLRRGYEVGIGKITNVQSNKQNVDRVEAPSEFGAQIESDFEVAAGDIIESYTTTMK